MMTQSYCYNHTTTQTIKGICWHDTGCDNPNIKRYVQPSDNAPDKDKMLEIIGVNYSHNDWNHNTSRTAGVNAFVGKLADGSISTVQVMPWNYRCNGVGGGKKGSLNNGWLQFEICEDGKNDKTYIEAAYKEACEITAYLCQKYGIDPNGTVMYNGIKVPTICCHGDASNLGLGDGHTDIYDWFPKFGKSMDMVRADVTKLLKGSTPSTPSTPAVTPEPAKGTEPGLYYSDLPMVKNGSKGEHVKFVQYVVGTIIDGVAGPKTDAAIKDYQKARKLTADGIVGPKTYEVIFKSIFGLK